MVFKNAKHIRHWIAFFVMAAVAIIVFDYGYSLYKINEKIEILRSFDLNFLTDILHEYISYGGHTAALVFLVISFILKIYFKIKSPLDDILTKIFKFTALTLVIIFLVSLKWPILYVRYLMPLATLFVILYCGIFYIFSETVFFFVRHKSTKSIATACAFAITSVGILSGQYLNTFIRVNYYENEKYYYIEDGYKQIRMDSAKPEVVSYILEEHMPTYFKYYEKKYDVKKIVSVSPADSAHKKQAAINSGLELGVMPKTIYYIRVIHKELETQSELIKIKDYTPSLIFSRGNMHLYKFTSND
ncbi:hypothetical protein K2P97_00005 [bacterium]|nr:hypothetical protein [bacterium]